MERKAHDLVVIGAGPGGYVAAIRAAQAGMDVACVERYERLGGTCLNVGCIPSKALLEASERYVGARDHLVGFGVRVEGVSVDVAAMQKRKESIVDGLTKGVAFLFKKNKIARYQGAARLAVPGLVAVDGAEPVELAAKSILIATGSKAATIPGVALDGERIGSSTAALAYKEAPRRLVVIGAGVIGLELGSVWRRLGAEVTVVEYVDRVLPEMDAELARHAHRLLKRQGLVIHTGARVKAARVDGAECVVEVEGMEPLRADRVLVATGRAPRTEGLGLAEAGVKLTAKGRIEVDERYETSVPGVYAVGDVIGGAMLAHKASEEGVACVEKLAGLEGHVDYGVIPAVVYTAPEIASVGRTQDALEKEGVPFKAGVFPFKANGRALAHGENDGLVKLLAHAETDAILGVHIIGPWASELVGQGAVAMAARMTSAAFAKVCAAHPTLSEALHEAALAVSGKAIHG
jgi:dihydrolipoamide dehydrogenase